MKSAICRFIVSGSIGLLCLMPPLAPAVTTKTVQVEIRNFAFQPQEITIAPGTKVVWHNDDEAPHTVTAVKHRFASQALDTDDRFSFVFAREGDYTYFCTLHPHMTGIVHVVRR